MLKIEFKQRSNKVKRLIGQILRVGLACLAICVVCACAPQQHVSTAWTMSYYCCSAYNNCNAACVNNFRAYSGSGSFASESDCLAWETGFLNLYQPQANVTSCTGNSKSTWGFTMSELKRFIKGRRDFGMVSTKTPGKVHSEALLDMHFGGPLSGHLKKNPNATAHILVGSVYGLDRHIGRLLAMGFKVENVFIHEIVPRVASKLRKACQKRGYPCHVVAGDMIANLKAFFRSGVDIAYIEFDGTDSYGSFEFDLFALLRKHVVPCVLVEGASRGQSARFKQWCKANKIRKTLDKKQDYKRYELERIAPIVAEREMSNYVSEYDTYTGRSGMYVQTFIAKESL
jgi:hypothetical protein